MSEAPVLEVRDLSKRFSGVLALSCAGFRVSPGEVIGIMQQDRATAIAGTLGTGPRVIPMNVALQSARADGLSASRTFNLTLANDQLFTPLLAYVALANTISAYERQFGDATFAIKSRAHMSRGV